MSNWNQLETQLRDWTPRPPSPELKKRIFAEPETAPVVAPRTPRGMPAFHWLAPAAACCLTLFTLLRTNNFQNDRPDSRENHAIFAVAMSSLTASNPTATLPAHWFGLSATDENLQWNIWSKASFDWTKEGQFLSTNRSLQLARTNYLMR